MLKRNLDRKFAKYLLIVSSICILTLLFVLSSCDKQVVDENETKAKELASTLTLEEKVGQLFIIRPEALINNIATAEIENVKDEAGIKEATPEIIQNMQKYNLGGIAMFAKNIKTPEQTTIMVQTLKENSKIPLFFGIDEEGGLVARIANNSSFGVNNVEGGMQGIGATADPVNAYNAAEYIGSYLEKYNFNLDFAPVCDVNTNPQGNSLKDRSFSSDPQLVAKMVEQYINGLHKHKVLSTMKHFPGIGDETGDTHQKFVVVWLL